MALQQGLVTITGRVGSTPQGFGHSSPPTICTFRLGCTRGYYDANRQWRSTPTTWITVKTFRALAANVISSVRTGQPVIVVGVLATEEWTAENGDKRSRTVLEASNVGHDLNYGTTYLNQPRRDAAGAGQGGDGGGAGGVGSNNAGPAGANGAFAAGNASLSSAIGNDPFLPNAGMPPNSPATGGVAPNAADYRPVEIVSEPADASAGEPRPAQAATPDGPPASDQSPSGGIPPVDTPPPDEFGNDEF
ncbi:single-stranded DNA-binding protein [Bifidobacterium amazonense]|uniref:Single-stranded DNA-binding protein n=1 Tax=Bifidobacterium amazonense TaxID=2809027 RepID=A0ABS9VUN4_9BIFI|nr:single-stranded DNA-binding protein [Bifidobacterium amazonense]MCH9275807.1 single-stranded DNA-binding protein [Bifidobacterium amazonense]